MTDTKDISLNPGTVHPTLSTYSSLSKSTTTHHLLHVGDNTHLPHKPLVQIGLGLQGAVFEHITHPTEAIKKEHTLNAHLATNLTNEVGIHRKVWKAFRKYKRLLIVREDKKKGKVKDKKEDKKEDAMEDKVEEEDEDEEEEEEEDEDMDDWDAYEQYDDDDDAKKDNARAVKVPEIIDYCGDADDDIWRKRLRFFPEGYQTKGAVVVMERILPLTKEGRKALVERFVDVGAKEEVLSREENKHCLVRTYLGRTKGKAGPKTDEQGRVSLRNLPLYLEGLREMGVDVVALAEKMGRAFAVMHWGAGVDGDDVEFVLGTEVKAGADKDKDECGFQERVVGLWLLDFGQCKQVSFGEGGEEAVKEVYQEFRGAMVMGDNRDFIPSCVDKESKEVWVGFRRGYTAAGKAVLKERRLQGYDVEEFITSYEEYAVDFP
ncbi:hypothetical protein B0T21DRAFT_394443 [Apiosordaria backusii]|uniref:DUF3669 domain-containing protein n=1 Tax=Apiosordaria backusii TaxID=314023 RepID=A0AA40B7H8_9PEZI|nr:hypothetical protein B0T21DRAFT_394443 [Apiosordaria backusii]